LKREVTLIRGFLPPDTIEGIRKCRNERGLFLSIATELLEQASLVKDVKIEALKSIAKTLLGIDLVDVKVAREKQLGRELNKGELELYERELKRFRG
jgi:hypothetical protein